MRNNKVLKIIQLAFLFIMTLSYAFPVIAQEPKPTGAGSAEEVIEKNAQILKNKIATKVAELTKKNNTVIVGIVKSILDQNLEINTINNTSKKVAIDDLLTIYKSADLAHVKQIKKNDIAKGDYVVAFGTDIDGETAVNVVYQQTRYDLFEGQIISVNKTDFSLDVVSKEKEEYTLDIDRTTSQFLVNPKTLAVEKTGFSKLKAGDTIHFVITHKDKKPARASAIRILIIPQEYFILETATPTKK